MTALPQPLIRHGLRIADAKHRRPERTAVEGRLPQGEKEDEESYAAAAVATTWASSCSRFDCER
jgi:hypothetical protein